MKKIFFLVLLLTVTLSFARSQESNRDTTFYANLNNDGLLDKINVKFTLDEQEGGLDYILTVNGKSITGRFEYSEAGDVKIIDINTSDMFQEIAVIGYGMNDFNDFHIYTQRSKPRLIGESEGVFNLETTGNGYATGEYWMGFWGLKKKYKLIYEGTYLKEIEEEEYAMNQECTATDSFKLLTCKDDNSTTAVEVKTGDKLVIIAGDVRPMKDTGDYIDDYSYIWYKIKTPSGKTGWIRLLNFQDKVDGLIWAG